jgi:DNA polymerase-3 subunit alpha
MATVGGLVTSVKPITIQKEGRNKGKLMATLELESFSASVKLVAYPDVYEKFKDMLVADNMLLVHGKIRNENVEGAKPELFIENCSHLFQSRETMAKSVHIRISSNGLDSGTINDIRSCCKTHEGDCYLVIHLAAADGKQYTIRAGNIRVSPNRLAIDKLRDILGKENVWIAKTKD